MALPKRIQDAPHLELALPKCPSLDPSGEQFWGLLVEQLNERLANLWNGRELKYTGELGYLTLWIEPLAPAGSHPFDDDWDGGLVEHWTLTVCIADKEAQKALVKSALESAAEIFDDDWRDSNYIAGYDRCSLLKDNGWRADVGAIDGRLFLAWPVERDRRDT